MNSIFSIKVFPMLNFYLQPRPSGISEMDFGGCHGSDDSAGFFGRCRPGAWESRARGPRVSFAAASSACLRLYHGRYMRTHLSFAPAHSLPVSPASPQNATLPTDCATPGLLSSRPFLLPMQQHHDWRTAALTLCLCIGLVISYLPQHFRIIRQNTSEGLSPWFLLLGSTSSAAGFLNLVTVQHTQIRCCRVVTLAQCVESTAGIVQVGLQWGMFSFIFVLYMLYFPAHLKFETTELPSSPPSSPSSSSSPRLPPVHLPAPPTPYPDPSFPDPDPDTSPLPVALARWALYLGVSSALLAAIQYLPQISYTYRARLVGALSVPMMCVQSPGAVAMVLSIALRPGTNWTSWITYAVAGMMQFTLLSICIAWKVRQHRLHIDDFGVPIHPESFSPHPHPGAPYRDVEESGQGGQEGEEEQEEEVDVPGLVVDPEDGLDAGAVRKALESALGEAVAGGCAGRDWSDGDGGDGGDAVGRWSAGADAGEGW
ncbi:hypothetical protein MVEN_02276200 [Mycena venus]|uniref:PQ loop repeat protein n=1 Tax=Mycena venus TaxID=2733690 RepID=A0A8H7CFX0_9AGAR|nr:hypothetical protein MVEN_02276200 [Mycena venus]